jgi:hypothetical protein
MWSYCGQVGFGILADADHVHDLALLAAAVPQAVEELLAEARAQPVAHIGPAPAGRAEMPPVPPPAPAPAPAVAMAH